MSGIIVPTADGPQGFSLTYDTSVDPGLQAELAAIDSRIREPLDIPTERAAVGILDLRAHRFAAIHPDRLEYAASIAKIGILLAWFALRPGKFPDPATRRELGLMAKASSNEMAAKFSRELGLRRIQEVLNDAGFYNADRGGGLWLGKHYGETGERYGDPIADHSAAATVRQVLRFFLLLEQDRLVSADASRAMRDIFASPEIPHDDIKFVRGLAGRDVRILRKWGTWETWRHDAGVIRGSGRHYILCALTSHPRGDEYLEALAPAVDDAMTAAA